VLIDPIEFPNPPAVGNEKLVGARNPLGHPVFSGDYSFTLAGSPGWDCDYIASQDRTYCSCIGYYYAPLDMCCDPTGCKTRPQ
jgi:hypothetical protein